MEKNCVICSKIEVRQKNDIRKQKIEGKPVVFVIEELFGLKIDAADRCKRDLPHKICSSCVDDLTTAYKVRRDLWKMEDLVAYWENNHEPGEVYSINLPQTTEDPQEEAFIEYPIDIKEEIILDDTIDDKPSKNFHGVGTVRTIVFQNTFQDFDATMEAKTGLELYNEGPKEEVLLEFEYPLDVKEEPNYDDSASEPKAKRFSCKFPNCNQLFKTRKDLEHHKRSSAHHKDTPTPKEMFPCNICGKMLKDKLTLAQHMVYVHTKKWYDCNTCPKRFKGARDLERHKLTHTHDRNFFCDICGYASKSKELLRLHLTRIHSNKQFFCDVQGCNKVYKNRSLLQIHIRLVHNKKMMMYKCDECEIEYKCYRSLMRHKKAHMKTEERVDG